LGKIHLYYIKEHRKYKEKLQITEKTSKMVKKENLWEILKSYCIFKNSMLY